jgi:hypothetical protein
MKKFTSLVIGLSLALAGAALAQQPEDQASPKAGKGAGKEHAAEAGAKQPGAKNDRAAAKAAKREKAETAPQAQGAQGATGAQGPAGAEANASAQSNASALPNENKQAKKGNKHGRGANANADANGSPSGSPAAASAGPSGDRMGGGGGGKGRHARGTNANANASPNASPAVAASASAAPSVGGAAEQNQQAKVAGGGGGKKKADPQQIQQIKQQHASFRAQPRPDKVPAVTFNQSYRIEGSDQWQGPQYQVFRSYHPERHDQSWYHSHFPRVELIGGGYYYWNGGYWYPAWGYNSANEYYAYDGPIYVGHRAEPPDRVIADVQAVLQQMGYYQGEVDGLLGPLTRQALRAYQSEQGLIATAVIDEPTLDALGMG